MSSSTTNSKGRGEGSHRRRRPRPPNKMNETASDSLIRSRRCLLVLHGNRQTGQLLLGRMDKFRRRLLKELEMECIAPDAPLTHPEDPGLRTWWDRKENSYQGLEQSLELLQHDSSQKDREVIGILGFSQGARLAHLVALLHTQDPETWFPSLKFVIPVAGYDAPIPDGFPNVTATIPLASLHVWGLEDPLIRPEQSQAVATFYETPQTYEHGGKHYIPMKGPDIQAFVDFINRSLGFGNENSIGVKSALPDPAPAIESTNKEWKPTQPEEPSPTPQSIQRLPDDEMVMLQQDEVQALEAIYPDEVRLKSSKSVKDFEDVYSHPIVYEIMLLPSDNCETNTNWPNHPLTLQVTCPHNYPLEAIPIFHLLHENNVYEFPSVRTEALMKTLNETATAELGMPSVLSCIYAARDYLDLPPSAIEAAAPPVPQEEDDTAEQSNGDEQEVVSPVNLPKQSTPETIRNCNEEGLTIAEAILRKPTSTSAVAAGTGAIHNKKGGSFVAYTIGLVGKPSAGKSTFFNAATAFGRQRGEKEGDPVLGGASMAPHPFTTIDPNIGYCLVPAPFGSCPEDTSGDGSLYGSAHGRDYQGRRFLPVLLKDVAGLVPGAYQGRGRGNKFLNDLCDADVLIHVVDASGTADAQGNTTSTDDGEDSEYTNPLDDLAWIRNELIEWVNANLMAKWDTIKRKGRGKLSDMFSGYGQSQAVTWEVFSAIDKFLGEEKQREHALDHIDDWDQGDVHRLVSAFLGVRFPMALALNKSDLISSAKHVKDILEALPVHGANVGTPLAARSEMSFVRDHLMHSVVAEASKAPTGIWQCLTSAVMLREPVLIFPVSDMATYAPLPGMNKIAVGDPSLPSPSMVTCIKSADGTPPTCWSDQKGVYSLPDKSKPVSYALRDVLMMKPGSTVEDVFLTLKRLGALGGEFVRAEGAGNIGDKPKPIPKYDLVGRHNRILKIMSNKRTAWQ